MTYLSCHGRESAVGLTERHCVNWEFDEPDLSQIFDLIVVQAARLGLRPVVLNQVRSVLLFLP